jgi:hypothetical protein
MWRIAAYHIFLFAGIPALDCLSASPLFAACTLAKHASEQQQYIVVEKYVKTGGG